MALFEDIPPLQSNGDKKIKNLQTTFSKNKTYVRNKLQNIGKTVLGYKAYLTDRAKKSLRLKQTLSFFIGNTKNYAPHMVLVFLTVITVASNYSVRAASADSSELVAADPSAEIAIAKSIDAFTPLIPNGSVALEKSYLASMEYNITKTTVDTVITERKDPALDNSSASISYVVKSGDTLTTLGWTFGVKLATLKYLNNISDADSIKPGQTLKIPKQGYEVPASQIAAKAAATAKKTTSAKLKSVATALTHSAGSKSNGYPYGYCTYYVATRRAVPSNFGNAKAWLGSAQRAGWSTGSAPVVGAIVVTSESWWGHVAYVESVSNGKITIAEMNAKGWGVISRRTINANGGVVRGYIY